jgi:hypothetical protein
MKGDANKFQLAMTLRNLFSEICLEEHQFHPTRKWRFDFAIPSIKLAIEYNGHGSTGGGHIGRHATITGMSGDCEKLNEAQRLGWRVLQFTALHFSEASRKKHKLSAPYDIIRTFTL